MRLKVSIILIISMILTTVAFAVDSSGANIPDLYDGLYPIKYSETGDVIFTSKNDSTWYNYSEGRWANAVTLDREGQMNPSLATVDNITGYYVWVPRYAYLIRTGYGSSETGRIDIRFIEGTTNKDKNGRTYFTVDDLDNVSEKWEEVNTVTYVGDRQMDYLIHPAFKFEEELSGIWVGKSEANQGIEREIELVKTIPNQALWTSIDINAAFEATRDMISKSENYDKYNLYGLSEEANTHLIKPVEYGAIVYLESSVYASKEYYGVENIDTVKEYIAGGLEGTTNIYMDKYLDIYTKDGEDVNDIKGSAYLETSDGVNGWYGQAITNITDEKTVIIKEEAYGITASNGSETDTGFRVAITRGTNKNEIKTIYQKDDSYWWLMQNGDLWAMGNNDDDQLGIGNIGYKPIPIKIEKDKQGNKIPAIERVVCIENNIYYIAKDGTKYLKGELNTDEIDLEQDTITILPNLQKEQLEIYNTLGEIKAIYGNQTSTIIKETDGDIYVIGDNTNNKLGISGIANITSPTKISIKDIKDVGIGSDFGVFLKEDGSIVGYGNPSKNGNGLTGIKQIAVGENTAYFMKNDGTVINNQGSIIENNAYKIVAGANHLVILKKDGTVQTIGQTNANLTNVIDIFAGKDKTVYITNDGKTYIMQNNTLTELALENIVYAKLNGTKPYFITYDRQLLYQDGTAVTVAGSELHRIREIKGDIALTEKNGLYNFGNVEYIRFEEGTYHKINSIGNQLEDYRIYGNSMQNGTPSPDNPVEIESVGEKSKNLFNVEKFVELVKEYDSTAEEVIVDGRRCISFKNDNLYHKDFSGVVDFEVGKQYMWSMDIKHEQSFVEDKNDALYIAFVYSDQSYESVIITSSGKNNYNYTASIRTDYQTFAPVTSIVSIANKDVSQIAFSYGYNARWLIDLDSIQIEEGTVATEYEPYYEGYKIPIKATGKNLFNKEESEIIKWGVSEQEIENGIRINSTSNVGYGSHLSYIIDKKDILGKKITVSADFVVSEGNACMLRLGYWNSRKSSFISPNQTYIKISNNGRVEVTAEIPNEIPEDFYEYAIFFNSHCNEVVGEPWIEVRNIQLEVGDKATEYEPYRELKTNIYLEEPLCGITYGNKKYIDYIDFNNQTVNNKTKKIVLTGDENWTLRTNCTNTFQLFSLGEVFNDGFSTHYEKIAVSDIDKKEGIYLVNTAYIIITDLRYSTIEDFKNFLREQYNAGRPVTCIVGKNNKIESVDIELPVADIFEGYNEIYIDTEVQPSNMMIQYDYYGSILD